MHHFAYLLFNSDQFYFCSTNSQLQVPLYCKVKKPWQLNSPVRAGTWWQWERKTSSSHGPQEETSSRTRLREGQPYFVTGVREKRQQARNRRESYIVTIKHNSGTETHSVKEMSEEEILSESWEASSSLSLLQHNKGRVQGYLIQF